MQKKYDQAVIITRNNAWLVPRTCEVVDALAQRGIKTALIAYTGTSAAWIEGQDVPPQMRPFRNWVDGYFDDTFTPWVEGRTREALPKSEDYTGYLRASGYLTLNQLAEKHGLPGATRVGVGDKGRAQYHKAVAEVVSPANADRTLGISIDTRLLIGEETLKFVPHHGFHPGRMRVYRPEQLKALGSDGPLKMVGLGNEVKFQGAMHLLGGTVDSGGVIDQFTLGVDPKKQSMFSVYNQMYDGLTQAYINNLDTILNPDRRLIITPQGAGASYKELTEKNLKHFLDEWPSPQWLPSGHNAPHGRLAQPQEFISALERYLPPGASVLEIPAGLGIASSEYSEFTRKFSARPSKTIRRDVTAKYDGLGLG